VGRESQTAISIWWLRADCEDGVVHLEEGGRVAFLHDLDAVLEQAGGAMDPRRALGHLVGVRARLVGGLALGVLNQLVLTTTHGRHQRVALGRQTTLELGTVCLHAPDNNIEYICRPAGWLAGGRKLVAKGVEISGRKNANLQKNTPAIAVNREQKCTDTTGTT